MEWSHRLKIDDCKVHVRFLYYDHANIRVPMPISYVLENSYVFLRCVTLRSVFWEYFLNAFKVCYLCSLEVEWLILIFGPCHFRLVTVLFCSCYIMFVNYR